MPRFTPHPYQSRAIAHAIEHECCALWMEPGLGKTATTYAVIEHLHDACMVGRVLIVAPKRVALTTWPQEVKKWGFRLTVQSIRGIPARRLKQLDAHADVWTINYELLPWLVKHYGQNWPFDMLVLDESSKVKCHSTQRFKAIRKVRGKIARLIELTGTPAPNGLLDLWAPIYLLDKGQRLGRTVTGYRQRWFESDYLGYNWTPRIGAEEEIHDRISDLCLTMRAEDYLSLPDFTEIDIPIELPLNARTLYRQLEKDMLVELEQTDIAAWNAAALTNKCRQLTAGCLYDEDGNWHPIHDAKLEALADLIDEMQGASALVAYSYRADLARLRERFPASRVLDANPQTIADWNAGKIPILLAHPASAGHGLNLQDGGRAIVWFSLDWSLELYQQFNARLYRQGQTKPVFVYRLTATDTVDQNIIKRLTLKCSVQDALLDALKTTNQEHKH